MGWRVQLKLFNIEYGNVEFLDENFDPNHPKIVRITEISIFTHFDTPPAIMTCEFFLLAN